ncbi:MAG TPA: GlsB/YeaQ/YmgE family stress response membrane protein [Vicinamibacterales bacterium]|nr:GlsB/YeaQ/YmgE family stress response membrane protein [Vicinamibacterales bacterium]
MTGVLGWIVFGLIVGAIAKLLTPGRDPGGFLITILLGIAGSVLGGYIGQAMGWYGRNQGAGLLMSIVGAVILLAIFHLFFRRRVVWRSRLTNRL